MGARKYDVIVWGATGFTGRLVAEYLLKQYGYGNELKWAIAGRNASKLSKIKQLIGNEEIDTIIANSKDLDSLKAMAKLTKVVCTTVGPYAHNGSELVEACIAETTHYCDLTGEVQWIRKMIDQNHAAAEAAKVRIVNCCGFDSIPSDLGVYFLQEEVQKKTGQYCSEIKFRLKSMAGGASGGTVASLKNVLDEAEQDPSIYEILDSPYSLNPEGERTGLDSGVLTEAAFDEDLGEWIMPFVMAAINSKIVRRTHALRGYPYGKDFQYNEATVAGTGSGGKIKAKMTAGMMKPISAGKPKWLLNAMFRFLPKPGEGPSKEKRENGFYNILFIGKTSDGQVFRAKVKGDRDPGYGSTSKMLAESAVSLAFDKDLPNRFGVLTAASAMEDALLKRLKDHAGLTFEMI